jgi:phosphoglycerate dehydrogenase-like enzyme
MKIVAPNDLHINYELYPKVKELFERYDNQITLYEDHDISQKELINRARDHEVVITLVSTEFNEEVIDSLPKLKKIITLSVGTNHIDLDKAYRRGIEVINFPGYNARAVAEFALGLILDLSRNITKSYISTLEGKWFNKKFDGPELKNKNLGILGAGNIGTELINIAKGMEMNPIVNTKHPSLKRAEKLGIEDFYTFEEVLNNSDYVISTLPVTKETENIFDLEKFKMMKDSAYFVNISRGQIVNTKDMYIALDKRIISGAAVDVLSEVNSIDFNLNEADEWLQNLCNMDNFIVTPHIATSSYESEDNIVSRFIGVLENILLEE